MLDYYEKSAFSFNKYQFNATENLLNKRINLKTINFFFLKFLSIFNLVLQLFPYKRTKELIEYTY